LSRRTDKPFESSDKNSQNKEIHQAETHLKKHTPPIQQDIFTSRKHLMDYFTVDGVVLRTGYENKRDWYLLPIKEMLDNSIDFLWNNYRGSNSASINVVVNMDDELFHLKIQNSNDKVPVFPNLEAIFDYDMRYGSKQDVHIISRGMLGDALKQILALGYLLLHTGDDGNSFTNKQWEHPLVIRHNKSERFVYVTVDKAAQTGTVDIQLSTNNQPYTDTEIELTLPIIDEVRNSLTRDYIKEFCLKYVLFTTDISFNFTINDLDLEVPGLHPIATYKDWSNADSIHSYKPQEFLSRIENIHEKDSTSVYDLLVKFREGSQISKSPENEIKISELLSTKDKAENIEQLYKELKHALPAPDKLSLPYKMNTKKRMDVLYARLVDSEIHHIGRDNKYPVYKLVRGTYNDNGLNYPFAFEILAVPFNEPYVDPNTTAAVAKENIIIGAINYSLSPKENDFEGEYGYTGSGNIKDVLHWFGFNTSADYNVKLPCVIIANLITPRRDPLGHGKTSINIQPFARTIQNAVDKIALGMKTFRAAGYSFRRSAGSSISGGHTDDGKSSKSAKAIVFGWLDENIGH